MSSARPANRLASETSPYLLQHAHNPVDWYPWGPEAFDLARRDDKPVLLSVGYSACHWCHVMERESFENDEIAALMNRLFVSIKVDREERPDVDQIYMQAVQSMTGRGGWPMTVFLTPDGVPFYGGTYFPPVDRHGMPGFPRLLQSIADAYHTRRGEVLEAGRQLVESMGQSGRLGGAASLLSRDALIPAYLGLSAEYDERDGGLGQAPKFPQPMTWEAVLRVARRTGDARALAMLRHTLTRMARGGMYDQLGGGFHRYSVDGQWLVPHFEKMLYDNAQLASLYLHGWLATGDPEYRRIAEETLDYVRREMTHPAGGFYSAQDADSEGVEGKFFVWSPLEIEAALGNPALARVALALVCVVVVGIVLDAAGTDRAVAALVFGALVILMSLLGRPAAAVSAVASFVVLNYLFIPVTGALTIESAEDLVPLVAFLFAGAASEQIAARVHELRRRADRNERAVLDARVEHQHSQPCRFEAERHRPRLAGATVEEQRGVGPGEQ